MTSKDKQIKRMRDRMERNQLREKAFSGQFEIASLFDTHDELKEMIAPFSMDFRIQYNRAFDLYVMGYWQHAKKEFKKAQKMLAIDFEQLDSKYTKVEDQLSENLLEYIKSLKYEAPEDWNGYKPFDE